MHVVAEGGNGVDGLDDIPGEVAGMRGGEAHAADAGDVADGGEQFGEGHLAGGIAVGVDVLAEELDLGDSRASAIVRASASTEAEVRQRSLPRV